MAKNSPVLSVIVRKLHEADKGAAKKSLDRLEQTLREWPGCLGVSHDHSLIDEQDTIATVISFKTLEDLIAWEQSTQRIEHAEALAQFTDGNVIKNRLSGIDSLLGTNHPPQKWKTVLVLTFWVLVVGAALGWVADSISPDVPSGYWRGVLLLIINILLNSYIFLPKSMALLQRVEEKCRAS